MMTVVVVTDDFHSFLVANITIVDDYYNDDCGDCDDDAIYDDMISTYNRQQHQQTLSLNLLLAPSFRLWVECHSAFSH